MPPSLHPPALHGRIFMKIETILNTHMFRAGKIWHTLVSCTYRVPEAASRRTKCRVPKIFISLL